ncbi:MAG TPA: alpha/beta hydrolase-fold protein [Streptosporangiaceae bacterium]|nr:alpha/beta hydrolase-fold protein [Streptosporangiaceae bacterium]
MSAESGVVTFRVPDPDRDLLGVRLFQDVRIPGDRLDFAYRDGSWTLTIDRPPVSRMEYLFELRHGDGGTENVLDVGNPCQVDGAFGPKSVLEFASYSPPAWLASGAEAGDREDLAVPVRGLGPAATIAVRIWSPAGAPPDEPLPLLVVHDGPEFDSLASLTRYLAAGVTGEWLPRLRAALLSPGSRDDWYSANPAYARALRQAVIPAITGRFASKARIGMGASLGGLAMLHEHCRYADSFDALFLQSSSFFSPRYDEHEQRFPGYKRIVRFVTSVHRGNLPGRPIPVVLTCGVIEENVANNRLMEQTLQARGYPASLQEVSDVHNYTAWRDALDPQLTALVWQVCP